MTDSQFQDKTETTFEFRSETIPFKICPLAGRIGAEIMGADLNQDLSEQVVQTISQTLVKYKVIFFRNQNLDKYLGKINYILASKIVQHFFNVSEEALSVFIGTKFNPFIF